MFFANPPRLPVTFTIRESTIKLAAELDIDIQAVCENALRAAVARRFQEVNAESIEYWNAWVEEHGLPLERYRQF